MAKFKIIVSDPETGESRVVEAEGTRAVPLIGKKLGEVIDGSVVGTPAGFKVQITGGSDKDGFPMRPNIHGGVRANVILSEGVGFQPSQKGERRRKTLRGNVVTEEIVQINMKIVEKPKKAEKEEKAEAEKEEKVRKKKASAKEAKEEKKKGEGEPTEETAQTA